MSKNLASESQRYKWGAKKLSMMVRLICDLFYISIFYRFYISSIFCYFLPLAVTVRSSPFLIFFYFFPFFHYSVYLLIFFLFLSFFSLFHSFFIFFSISFPLGTIQAVAAHFSHFSYIPHRNIILCHGKSFRKSVLNKLIVAASENYENQI